MPTASSWVREKTSGPSSWPTYAPDSQKPLYRSQVRTLEALPPIRRDLIKRHLYLVPNSIVVSRGCPHTCDFCYKEAFFAGGKGFYTQRVDAALAEISNVQPVRARPGLVRGSETRTLPNRARRQL